MARGSRLGRAWGLDHSFIARFVDIWRHPRNVGRGPIEEGTPRTPVSMNDIAWELGIGQPKVAISMKYAEKEGWVTRTSARGDQGAWEPTEKALAQYPEDGPQVMPVEPGEQVAPGITVTPAEPGEIEEWSGEGYTRIDPRPGNARIPRGKPFKGYLPEGDG